jgi:hypothetical protein
MTNEQVWAVVREAPNGPAAVVAVFVDPVRAATVADQLGEGHHAAPCPLIRPGTPVLVAQTWRCRATVTAGAVAVGTAERLPGASELLVGMPIDPVERVVVDEQAGELESTVRGQTVAYVDAYAESPDRARELVTAAAEDLARGQRPS